MLWQVCARPPQNTTAYEQFKHGYLDTAADCQRQGFAFVPIVAEPSGGWGPSAQCVFKAFARSIAALSGRTPEVELQEHRQALGVLLRQANARAIFRRDPGSGAQAEDPLMAARLALDM